MLRKKSLKKTTSVLATVLLSASLLTPSFSSAAAVNGKPYTSVSDGKNVTSVKLSDRLLKQFTKADEKVTFLIKFKEQADAKS